MAGEITRLSGGVDQEPTVPVPSAPSAQGQSNRRSPEGKTRRPPPEEQVSTEPLSTTWTRSGCFTATL